MPVSFPAKHAAPQPPESVTLATFHDYLAEIDALPPQLKKGACEPLLSKLLKDAAYLEKIVDLIERDAFKLNLSALKGVAPERIATLLEFLYDDKLSGDPDQRPTQAASLETLRYFAPIITNSVISAMREDTETYCELKDATNALMRACAAYETATVS